MACHQEPMGTKMSSKQEDKTKHGTSTREVATGGPRVQGSP